MNLRHVSSPISFFIVCLFDTNSKVDQTIDIKKATRYTTRSPNQSSIPSSCGCKYIHLINTNTLCNITIQQNIHNLTTHLTQNIKKSNLIFSIPSNHPIITMALLSSSKKSHQILTSLVQSNKAILSQKLLLLDLLESKYKDTCATTNSNATTCAIQNFFFTTPCPIVHASIGQHYRHSMDHIELAALVASSSSDINNNTFLLYV